MDYVPLRSKFIVQTTCPRNGTRRAETSEKLAECWQCYKRNNSWPQAPLLLMAALLSVWWLGTSDQVVPKMRLIRPVASSRRSVNGILLLAETDAEHATVALRSKPQCDPFGCSAVGRPIRPNALDGLDRRLQLKLQPVDLGAGFSITIDPNSLAYSGTVGGNGAPAQAIKGICVRVEDPRQP